MFRNIKAASAASSMSESAFLAVVLIASVFSTMFAMFSQYLPGNAIEYAVPLSLAFSVPVVATLKPRRPLPLRIKALLVFCAILPILSMRAIA